MHLVWALYHHDSFISNPRRRRLGKKNDLENEIEAKKLEVEANAKQNFQASHSLKHFL
jgi:hypothetical protein